MAKIEIQVTLGGKKKKKYQGFLLPVTKEVEEALEKTPKLKRTKKRK